MGTACDTGLGHRCSRLVFLLGPGTSNAVLFVGLEVLDDRIGESKGSMGDRFTRTAASRAGNAVFDRIVDHENPLRMHESDR